MQPNSCISKKVETVAETLGMVLAGSFSFQNTVREMNYIR
jgi:hypothetical protein